MTARDLIIAALQDLNMVDGSNLPDPDDLTLAFSRLNDMVDDLANENLLVYTLTRTTWTLTPSQASYTVGAGGNIPIVRPPGPNAIANIGYQDTSISPTFETLLGPVLTNAAYQAIPFKTLTDTYPTAFYYNPVASLGVLSPFPIPTSTTLQGVIYAPTPVAEFATLNDAIIVVPGFRRFLRNQLVCELATAFEKPVPEAALQAAMDSRAKIKRTNTRLVDLTFDLALTGGDRPSNIYTG